METKNKSELTLAEKIKKIKETTFHVGHDEELTSLAKEAYGTYWDDDMLYPSGYMVFIDTIPKQVIRTFVSMGEKPKVKKPYFVDYLKKAEYKDFNELLMLVTIYPCFKSFIKNPPSSPTGLKNKFVDFVLNETKGWLIYSYQLEKLYIMATGNNLEQAILFRKNINARRAGVLEEAIEMKLFGMSLYEILDSRRIIDGLGPPNYAGAYKLYRFLNS